MNTEFGRQIDMREISPFINPEESRKAQQERDREQTTEYQAKFSKEFAESKLRGTLDSSLREYYENNIEPLPLQEMTGGQPMEQIKFRTFYGNKQLPRPVHFNKSGRYSGEPSGINLRLGFLLGKNAAPESRPYETTEGKTKYMNFLPEVAAEDLLKWYHKHLQAKVDDKKAPYYQKDMDRDMEFLCTHLAAIEKDLIDKHKLPDPG